MNKNSAAVYILLSVCLLSILITGIYFSDKKTETVLYTLKEYNGKLAVFKDKEEKPVRILDTNVAVFPEKDKILLNEGISGLTESELYSLIEDFSG